MLNTLLELSKVKITFAVSLTTITGYLLAKESFDTGIILPTIGIFLLACGSSAINHYQEREKDALMNRTRRRPIPSGRISPLGALLFAFITAVMGTWLLYKFAGFLAMQLGLLALIWYNLVYTPLKRKTAFAVVPGAIIGSIPPLVGWVSAGGSLSDTRAGILAFFFFIWQVPHFWLLMLKYGEEYEKAGYPSLTRIYSGQAIRFTTFIWTLATAVTALMIPVYKITETVLAGISLFLASIWLVVTFTALLRKTDSSFNPFRYFMRINYYILFILIVVSIDSLTRN